MKKFYVLLLGAFLLVACSTETPQKANAELTVAQINANTSAYVGQTVSITGTVNHVCRHGGKRLFVMGENSQESFKVEAGTVGSFDVALEGSEIRVTGVVQELKVDKAYLDNWEKEVCATEAENEAIKHAGGNNTSEAHAEQEMAENPTLQNINSLRQELTESNKEYLSFYHLEATSFEEIL